jgi:hypothetical protein
LIDPVYWVAGHDEDGYIVTDSVIKGGSPGIAAFHGYMAVFKVLEPRALFALKGTQHL